MDQEFDRTVDMILSGYKLEKYIDLFHANEVNLELFKTFVEEDLKLIGIENHEDIQLLLKHIGKMNKDIVKQFQPLTSEQCLNVLKQNEQHLDNLSVATSYLWSRIQAIPPKDCFLTTNETAKETLTKLHRKFQNESEKFLGSLTTVATSLGKQSKGKHSVNYLFAFSGVTMAIIAAFIMHRKKYI